MYTVILDTLQTCNMLCTVSTYLFTTLAFAALVNNSVPSIAVMWESVRSECFILALLISALLTSAVSVMWERVWFILALLTSAIISAISSGLGCIQNSKQKLILCSIFKYCQI